MFLIVKDGTIHLAYDPAVKIQGMMVDGESEEKITFGSGRTICEQDFTSAQVFFGMTDKRDGSLPEEAPGVCDCPHCRQVIHFQVRRLFGLIGLPHDFEELTAEECFEPSEE